LKHAKVAFFGAGSFVFGPTLIAQCILENRISGLTWSLYDPNFAAVELMAAIGDKMAESVGVDATFTAHSEADDALDGADFVICSAAVDINRRFAIDREILNRLYPNHLISEFGGIAGIGSSLRQMTMIAGLAERIKQKCPGATLLDISNPLPRVCQAAYDVGVDTVGFCSVSIQGYGRLLEILKGTRTEYPFIEAQRFFRAKMGGTNHLSWLVELQDTATGADLMPELRRRLDDRKGTVASKCEEYGRRTGYFLMSGDHHVQDFLPIDGLESSIDSVTHGTLADREARLSLLRNVARGAIPVSELEAHPSWERPSDFIEAKVYAKDATFTSLNLPNSGQIANLAKSAYVETAASISGGQLQVESLMLPESTLPFSTLAVEINLTLAKACRARSLADLHRVLELDPTIEDRAKAKAALDECLTAHIDVIGRYE